MAALSTAERRSRPRAARATRGPRRTGLMLIRFAPLEPRQCARFATPPSAPGEAWAAHQGCTRRRSQPDKHDRPYPRLMVSRRRAYEKHHALAAEGVLAYLQDEDADLSNITEEAVKKRTRGCLELDGPCCLSSGPVGRTVRRVGRGGSRRGCCAWLRRAVPCAAAREAGVASRPRVGDAPEREEPAFFAQAGPGAVAGPIPSACPRARTR